MKASVIFTTYNHPKWLEKTLWGFSAQSVNDFEIIVADDGSTEETLQIIERFTANHDLPVKHIWHEDNGFQKCRILNRAIVASEADYLIFTDGDCIPHPDFVKNHIELSEKNTFLSGGYFKLPMDVSRNITQQNILEHKSTQPSWLRANGVPFTFKISKLYVHSFFGRMLDKLTITKATWNGHSASTWKELVLKTNGFDERMQYGGQDREFGERLMNMGVKIKQVRYRCSCVHLDHKRGYAKQESINKNRQIRNDTSKNKITRTKYGITEMPD
jgi:glycosyltransferase involved in cell wall biosynthesis